MRFCVILCDFVGIVWDFVNINYRDVEISLVFSLSLVRISNILSDLVQFCCDFVALKVIVVIVSELFTSIFYACADLRRVFCDFV